MSSRAVLYSERQIIEEAYLNTDMTAPSDIFVLQEEYAEPNRTKPVFNVDFSLWLLPELPPRSDRAVKVVPVRAHSMGAEYFVTIRNDGIPALIELIGGESIPLESFAASSARINTALHTLFDVPCEKADYLRIVELEKGVAFLMANSPLPELLQAPASQVETEGGLLWVRRSDPGKLMVDGFLRN